MQPSLQPQQHGSAAGKLEPDRLALQGEEKVAGAGAGAEAGRRGQPGWRALQAADDPVDDVDHLPGPI